MAVERCPFCGVRRPFCWRPEPEPKPAPAADREPTPLSRDTRHLMLLRATGKRYEDARLVPISSQASTGRDR